jgi:DNA-damage-inducible protein D
MQGTDILVSPGESPFDTMRHTDATGREYWLARALMKPLGYAERWYDFRPAVERAEAACRNAGQDPVRNFRRVVIDPSGRRSAPDLGRTGQRFGEPMPSEDFELSRFGAYLVSMNGDPRKPEVAAAQTYFATATRWAETAQRTGFDLPKNFAEALELAAKQQRALEAAEQEAAAARQLAEDAAAVALKAQETTIALGREAKELDGKLNATLGELGAALPKVEAYDAFLDQAGAFPLATAAQMLSMGRQTLINLLGGWKVLVIRPGHSDHLRPYSEHLHEGRFVVKSTDVPITHRDGSNEVITRGTTLVTPKGLDYVKNRLRREERVRIIKHRPTVQAG